MYVSMHVITRQAVEAISDTFHCKEGTIRSKLTQQRVSLCPYESGLEQVCSEIVWVNLFASLSPCCCLVQFPTATWGAEAALCSTPTST